MEQQQREQQRGEDLQVWPPTLGIETAVPSYEVQLHNIIIDAWVIICSVDCKWNLGLRTSE